MSYDYCDASALERCFSILGIFVKENNSMKVEPKRTKNQQKEVDVLVKKLNKLGINQSNLFEKRSYKRKKYDRKIDKLFAKIRKYPSSNSGFWREIGEIKLDGENLELGQELQIKTGKNENS